MGSIGALRNPKGAPQGNSNAVKHGLTSKRRHTVLGHLPKGCSWIKSLVTQTRNRLEAAVIERKGELTAYDECVIQTAAKWEQTGLLAQRWLRLDAHNMTHDQRLAYAREIAKASTERDKCLRELGLHERRGDPVTILYAPENNSGSEGERNGSQDTQDDTGRSSGVSPDDPD